MINQASLFNKTIQERFERFHAAHPEVYSQFRQLANDLLDRGTRHYGAKAIMEVIRFHRTLATRDDLEDFRINNNFTSRYARMLIDEDPKFAEFFETRNLKSA